ncbi:putative bifunctional diguanylate cyclase/phosphodiesterase [Celerinatantimonas sp. MCCC 1A17872]|uniref:putative bifunctional diguanylate cyclase/phosphodiesterase n=1 Tax=Celerinatantimonas sp. MCCC 1A17872 TaxID=3177514 RepID=UPI0038C1421D
MGQLKSNSPDVPMRLDETARLNTLTQLSLLDLQPEERFNRLVELARHITQSQAAMFSLIDKDRQWVKAQVGITIPPIPREWSICSHTLNEPSGILVIEDTHQDARFENNPLVKKDPHIRAYLGCQVKAHSSYALGTLCVFDQSPRTFSQTQIHELTMLADIIGSDIWRDQQLIEAHRDLLQKTLYDPLTGLPGQQLFIQKLTTICDKHSEQNYQLLMLNIQRFRIVNRIYGHARGDAILQIFSQILGEVSPENAFISRLRDDRFAILYQLGEDQDDSTLLIRLRTLLEHPLIENEPSLTICASVGVAKITPEVNIPDELINQVSTAMHAAPDISKGISVESFEPSQENHLARSFEIENKLAKAIEDHQFEMLYQPIVRLSDGQMSGFEALIRWPWKENEYISPMEFIPVAENSGLIKSLTRWIIRKTCADFASVYDQLPESVYMSVNISSADLLDPKFTDDVLNVLKQNKLPAQSLKLEVTEHSVINDLKTAINQMKILQQSGIRFAIDDFGTGHASLRYLQLLPAAYLKIDRSFIGGVTELERDAAITRATIALAHSLDKNVIAEGVEKWEQAEFLRAHQAEYAQGWFYAKPMPIEELANYRPPQLPQEHD